MGATSSRDHEDHPSASPTSKRGRALSGKPFVSHSADRDFGSTVLSVLAGAHSVREGVLGFFDTREARALRLVCAEFRDAVAVVPWADMETRITGNVRGWRRSFPHATKANIAVVSRFNAIVDADFVHFEGLHTLNMHGCGQAGITDAAFVHLEGTTKRASRTLRSSTSRGYTRSTCWVATRRVSQMPLLSTSRGSTCST